MKTTIPTITAIFIFAISFLYQGCVVNGVNTLRGDGNVLTKHYEIDQFKGLKLTGMFNVILIEGEKENLVIETDSNLYKHINVEVKDNFLSIYSDRDIVLRPTRLDIYVTYTGLDEISSSGACNLTFESTIRSETFILKISGAGSGKMNIETEKLKTDISGAASFTITGIATTHNALLSGAGNLQAQELFTENTIIDLSGAGAAVVYATETLDARLSGVGSIKYAGKPEIKSANVTGIGRIKDIE